jgi:hypothetical protein
MTPNIVLVLPYRIVNLHCSDTNIALVRYGHGDRESIPESAIRQTPASTSTRVTDDLCMNACLCMNATVLVYALECFPGAGMFLHAFDEFNE